VNIELESVNFLGYTIEKCLENSDRWEKVSGSFLEPKGTIKGLEMNKKYKFRVKAENIYGTSEPLETSSSILVKPPYGTQHAELVRIDIRSRMNRLFN
jgi:hypothetical protein